MRKYTHPERERPIERERKKTNGVSLSLSLSPSSWQTHVVGLTATEVYIRLDSVGKRHLSILPFPSKSGSLDSGQRVEALKRILIYFTSIFSLSLSRDTRSLTNDRYTCPVQFNKQQLLAFNCLLSLSLSSKPIKRRVVVYVQSRLRLTRSH